MSFSAVTTLEPCRPKPPLSSGNNFQAIFGSSARMHQNVPESWHVLGGSSTVAPVSICGSNMSFPSLFPWIVVLKIRRSCYIGSVPLKLMESQVILFGLGRTGTALLPREVEGLLHQWATLYKEGQGTRARPWKPQPDKRSPTHARLTSLPAP